MTPVACRYCGRPILWGVDEKGTRHPIDPSAPIFEAVSVSATEVEVRRVARMGHDNVLGAGTFGFGVSHFSTCKGATQASEDAKAKRELGKAAPLPIPAGTPPRGGDEADG